MPLAILGASVFVMVLVIISKPSTPAAEIEETAWPVSIRQIKVTDHNPQLILYGQVESPHNSQLTSPISTYVIAVPVKEGDSVEQGQILVQLDPQDMQLLVAQREADVDDVKAQIITLKNQYETDKKGLERERRLFSLSQDAFSREQTLKQKNLSSKAQLDRAQETLEQQGLSLAAKTLLVKNHESQLAQLDARLKRAEALLKQAQLDQTRTELRAPYDGRITKLHVAPGERVQMNTPIIELYDTALIEVRAQVPIRYLDSVRESKISNESNASIQLQGNHHLLSLERLAGEVGSNRGGLDALFRLQSNNVELEVGRTLKVTLTLPSEANTFIIPNNALYDGNRVYRLNNDRLEAITIEVVGDYYVGEESFLVVRSDDVQSNDSIVTTQLPNAVTGLKVKVIDDSTGS